MLLSFERVIVGALAFVIPGATLLHRNGLVQAVLPESKNMSKRTIGVPQELGRSCRLLGNSRLELPGYQLQASAVALVRRGAKRTSANRGTAKRRQRSAAGWAAGSRSALIVPTKLANGPQPEPVEESEAPDHGTVFEKHDECIEIRQPCPRNRNG